jgi:hypothetical protein
MAVLVRGARRKEANASLTTSKLKSDGGPFAQEDSHFFSGANDAGSSLANLRYACYGREGTKK